MSLTSDYISQGRMLWSPESRFLWNTLIDREVTRKHVAGSVWWELRNWCLNLKPSINSPHICIWVISELGELENLVENNTMVAVVHHDAGVLLGSCFINGFSITPMTVFFTMSHAPTISQHDPPRLQRNST